jgi:hypothetical protein
MRRVRLPFKSSPAPFRMFSCPSEEMYLNFSQMIDADPNQGLLGRPSPLSFADGRRKSFLPRFGKC